MWSWQLADLARPNLVTAIADAKLDSIPLIAITGQVPTSVIGTDAFQETPIVEVCRGITKHHYLVTKVDDVARVMKEAFHIATTGRPGPVLIDMPKDVQMDQCNVDWDVPMNLPGYRVKTPLAQPEQIRQIAAAIKHSKRPLLYVGGGVIGAEGAAALRKLVDLTGIPVTMTVMGLGLYPNDGPLSLDMLGMHGAAYANYAVRDCDLLIALGVRFDDRVTGKKEVFAQNAKIIHVDIDPSEINKNKVAHIPVCSDVRYALDELNKIVEAPDDISGWVKHCKELKQKYPFHYDDKFDGILQQHAIRELSNLTQERDTFVTCWCRSASDVGSAVLQLPSTSSLAQFIGTRHDGFGLPAAMVCKPLIQARWWSISMAMVVSK